MQRSSRPVHLLGEGILYHHKFIPADNAAVIVTDEAAWTARASAVVKIGHELALAGQFADPDTLVPVYIRPPEAEEKFAAKSP